MRVLLTGGAGFIGGHVLTELLGRGHEVRVFDSLRADVHHGATPHLPAELVVGDVRDASAVDGALREVDAVCHLAAKVGLGVDVADLPDYVSSNDLGTAVVLAAMTRAGIGRVTLAGSMVAYGPGLARCTEHGPVSPAPRLEADLARGRFEPGCPLCGRELAAMLVTEAAPVDPQNGYAASKVAQEHLTSTWARATGASASALRYHNVYGPGMPRNTPYAGVAAVFLSSLRQGRSPQVFEDGRQQRDFVHVRDVATATADAVEHEYTGMRVFNVGSGTPRTIGEMATQLSSAVAGPVPVITGAYRLGDVRHITADSSRLQAELGWTARVGFAEGLAELADVFVDPNSPVRPENAPTSVAFDIVLPCLDEAEALPWVMSRLPAAAHAIVVDNGSRDGSADIARSLGAEVVDCSQRGYGAACHAGLEAATADVVAFCDCDASIDPAVSGHFVDLVRRGRADLVVARRRPASSNSWPLHARIANHALTWRVRRRINAPLHDLGPLRVARRRSLLELNIADRRSGYPLETVLRAAAAGWTITGVDTAYTPRLGRSKVTGTARGTVQAVRDMRAVFAQCCPP